MQKGLILVMVSILLTAAALVRLPVRRPAAISATDAAKNFFRRDAGDFGEDVQRLRLTVNALKPGEVSPEAIAALKNCRLGYKKIESFVSSFFPDVAIGINGPPVYEGEEPYMEYREPTGLQVIEALLFGKTRPPDLKRLLLQQTDLLQQTATALPGLLYRLEISQAALLQSMRLETIRMATLGLTGYDAPVLKTGIPESSVVCSAIGEQLSHCNGAEKLARQATDMARQLKTGTDFDAFDRAAFLTKHLIPFQKELKFYCDAKGIELPAAGLLRSGVTDIFSANALRPAVEFGANDALVRLGRKWFGDKSLSRGKKKSCSSCHEPDKAFTDGFTVGIGLNPEAPLKRNSPTLLYSAYQYHQFWDGRAAGLESQIKTVLHDVLEMGADSTTVARSWNTSTDRQLIAEAFSGNSVPDQTEMIAKAVGAYVNTLGAFNSSFDRFMQGDEAAMSESEKKGFNLFMGKARCGSCHFAPLFNGTLPPDFDRTEFEVIGTTASVDFSRPVISKDPGRYAVYPLPFNRYAFKTPTVRNAARTAPYMHNGRFKKLNDVMRFYNQGGGAGLGLNIPGQTLSSDSLRLEPEETEDLIAFISALNDKSELVKQ